MTEADSPLANAGVLVTRPEHQAQSLMARVAAAGGRPLACPVLAIEWRDDESARARLAGLTTDDWLVVVSPNAVDALVRLVRDHDLDLPTLRYAAVGWGTADALAAAGFPVAAVPARGEGAAALLADPAFRDVAGRRVAICRGEGGRRILDEGLKEAGAEPVPLTLYRRVARGPDIGQLEGWFDRNALDIVMLNSGGAVTALMNGLPAPLAEVLGRCPVVAPSERVLKKAARAGFSGPLLRAASAGNKAMVATAIDWWQYNRNQA